MRFFKFTINIHGATILPARDKLSNASLNPVDIDVQIEALKADLDRLGKEMKSAIVEQRAKPLGLQVSS